MPRGVKYATEAERRAARKASQDKYLATPEGRAKALASGKRWREANPDKVKANNEAWRKVNTPKVNPEAARQYSAAWYQENKERRAASTAAWRKANPEKQAEYQRRRRARKFGTDPDFTPEQWLEVLEEFGYQCAYCDKGGIALEQDHVWPVSRGGRHTRDNIVPACRSCNASKKDKLLAEWYRFV